MKIVSHLCKMFILAFVLGIALGVSSLTARAAVTLQVTTTADSLSNDGACSLREAITAANTNTTVNECVHDGSSGADTLTFAIPDTDTGCSATDVCTITLGSTLPAIDDELTIDGSAQDITVSGNNSVRVIKVNSGKTLNVQDLTIANAFGGVQGSGIDNYGTLNVTRGSFSTNTATYGGSIYNNSGGRLNVTDSTFSSDNASLGGSIYNYSGSILNVTDSTFSGNHASYAGGGIYNHPDGKVMVVNSTFSTNSAASAGGAIYNYDSGTLIIVNSTVVDNSTDDAGGGIYNGGGHSEYPNGILEITNSTIVRNSNSGPSYYGGGIYNGGIARLRNTIVANSAAGMDCAVFGLLIADNHNLDSDGTCGNATTKTSAQLALAASLADNGGATQTLAIGTNSAAIDAGDDIVCAATIGAPNYGAGGTDQRGVTRPQGIKCDVGAFEREIVYLTVIKHVDNSSGGSALASQWTMNVSGVNPSQASFPGAESPGVKVILDAGAYGVTESNGPSGYQDNYSADCNGTLAIGESKTCTITNIQFTPTPTNTPTNTPTHTNTFTPTNTPTRTNTFTPTNTPTRTNTFTPTNTPTRTNTPTNTATFTATYTPIDTLTPSITPTTCIAKPAKPTLVSPKKDALVNKPRVKLVWNLVPCALTFNIKIVDVATGQVVQKKNGWQPIEFTTKALTRGKTYAWQVSACNAIGCGRFSKPRLFTVKP